MQNSKIVAQTLLGETSHFGFCPPKIGYFRGVGGVPVLVLSQESWQQEVNELWFLSLNIFLLNEHSAVHHWLASLSSLILYPALLLSNSIHHSSSSISSLCFLGRSCYSTKASLSRWSRDMQSGTQVEDEYWVEQLKYMILVGDRMTSLNLHLVLLYSRGTAGIGWSDC